MNLDMTTRIHWWNGILGWALAVCWLLAGLQVAMASPYSGFAGSKVLSTSTSAWLNIASSSGDNSLTLMNDRIPIPTAVEKFWGLSDVVAVTPLLVYVGFMVAGVFLLIKGARNMPEDGLFLAFGLVIIGIGIWLFPTIVRLLNQLLSLPG